MISDNTFQLLKSMSFLLKNMSDMSDCDIPTDALNMFYLSDDQIYCFLTDYKTINFDDDNIKNYYSFQEFYCLDIGFPKYVFENFVLNHKFLDKVCESESMRGQVNDYCCTHEINPDTNIIKHPQIKSIDHLRYFYKYIPIEQLNCHYFSKEIVDFDIQQMQHLKFLKCFKCINLTDDAFQTMPYLEFLECNFCPKLTDKALENLPQLKELHCVYTQITATGLTNQTELQKLTCYGMKHFDDCAIKKLTKLQTLSCVGCELTDDSLKHLPELKTLVASACNIADNGTEYLSKIENLYYDGCDMSIRQLPNFKELKI